MAICSAYVAGYCRCAGCANRCGYGVELGVALHPPAHTLQVAERAGMGRAARLPCAGDGPQLAVQPQQWATLSRPRFAAGDDFRGYPFLLARAGPYDETLAGTARPDPEARLA